MPSLLLNSHYEAEDRVQDRQRNCKSDSGQDDVPGVAGWFYGFGYSCGTTQFFRCSENAFNRTETNTVAVVEVAHVAALAVNERTIR